MTTSAVVPGWRYFKPKTIPGKPDKPAIRRL
jgi:hypothetical protein